MPEKFLRRREAATFLTEQLGLPTSFSELQKLACVGGGPAYEIYGKYAVYRPGNLIAWAKDKLSPPRHSTSEEVVAGCLDAAGDAEPPRAA
jgi:hypothetical protein